MAEKECKIAVLGPGGVGKSALTVRFTHGEFLDAYDPTIADTYTKKVTVDGEQYVLDIMDTAGQEEFSATLDQCIMEANGLLIVFAINQDATFDELERFEKKIERIKCPNDDDTLSMVPIVLVGNKCDLVEERAVDKEQGEAQARAWGAAFLEASAKDAINVEEAYFQVVREVKKSQEQSSNAAAKQSTSATAADGGCNCQLL